MFSHSSNPIAEDPFGFISGLLVYASITFYYISLVQFVNNEKDEGIYLTNSAFLYTFPLWTFIQATRSMVFSACKWVAVGRSVAVMPTLVILSLVAGSISASAIADLPIGDDVANSKLNAIIGCIIIIVTSLVSGVAYILRQIELSRATQPFLPVYNSLPGQHSVVFQSDLQPGQAQKFINPGYNETTGGPG